MSRLSRIILGYLVSFLFIVIPAKAQKEAEVYNVDSSLYAYYQRCQEHLLEPVVLSMSDTLFPYGYRAKRPAYAGSSSLHPAGLLLLPGQ